MRAILNGAGVRDGVRYFTATVDNVRHEIPEAWAVAYCTAHPGADARDAAHAWHERAITADDVEWGLA